MNRMIDTLESVQTKYDVEQVHRQIQKLTLDTLQQYDKEAVRKPGFDEAVRVALQR